MSRGLRLSEVETSMVRASRAVLAYVAARDRLRAASDEATGDDAVWCEWYAAGDGRMLWENDGPLARPVIACTWMEAADAERAIEAATARVVEEIPDRRVGDPRRRKPQETRT